MRRIMHRVRSLVCFVVVWYKPISSIFSELLHWRFGATTRSTHHRHHHCFQHLLWVYKKENIKCKVHISGQFWGESTSFLAIGEGNPMVTVEYPRQRASNAEIVSRLWHLHVSVFVSLKWRADVTTFCHRIVLKLCHQLENCASYSAQ